MPFENPLLAKLFEGILEGQPVDFRNDLLPRDEVLKAIDLLPIPLSRRQREAVFRAWTYEVSYIQGPPGTGKSHTITAIMLAALFLKKRVLLVSHKKPAIDVVYEKLGQFLGAGSAIYASNESAQRQQMRGELQQWLSRCGTLQGRAELEELRRKRAHHRGKVEQLRQEVEQLETQIKNALEWERDYYHRQERLDHNRKAYLGRFGDGDSQSLELSPAANPVKALAVLRQAEKMLGEDIQTSGGNVSRQKALHLRRFFGACVNQFFAEPSRLPPNLAAVNYLREHLELTEDFQRASESLARVIPDYLSQARKTLHRKRDEMRKQQGELAKAQLAAHVVGNLQETSDELQKFRSMIHHANATLIGQKMQGINFAEVIETLPLWVGQMRHLGEFLPFESKLFDLVVVDEASQVNIAEIIPAFFRGARICVVGDDKQLGLNAAGLFTLNRQFEELIWNRHFADSGVLYSQADQRLLLVSKHSILDFIRSLGDGKVPQTTLDEHFRSYPQLASFTSDTFYQVDGGLRLMKEVPKNLELECFNCIEVGGARDAETKIVTNEIDELLRWLTKLIRARHYEQDPALRAHGFTNERPPTLGVISFLTSQRDVIRERVVEEFSPAEMQLCHLLVGTPEDFQGNERDIIFVTLGLDGVSRWGRGHYEDRKRFNVATSRAIHYTLLIYGGIPSNARLIKSYLTHFGKSWRARQEGENNEADGQTTVHRYRWDWNRKLHRELCESEFEHRVADCLEEFVGQHGGAHRIKLFNQVQASREIGVASCGQKRLDFVLLNGGNGSCVAVEVDGRDHFTQDGRTYSEEHLERVEILRRAGWQIVHVPYYRWWRNGWLSDRNDPHFQKVVAQLFAELRACLGLA
jgi:hypothetical protein